MSSLNSTSHWDGHTGSKLGRRRRRGRGRKGDERKGERKGRRGRGRDKEGGGAAC